MPEHRDFAVNLSAIERPTAPNVYLVDVSHPGDGAAWAAVFLRELRYAMGDCQIQNIAGHDVPTEARANGVFIVGFESSMLTQRARLVQTLASDQTIVVVSGRSIPTEVALTLRAYGAQAVMDSLASTRAAYRLAQRFFQHQRATNQGHFWRQLPLPNFST